MDAVIIATPRLLLRLWKPEDLAPFAAMNADPRVMEFYPDPLTREESDAMAVRIQQGFSKHGFGLWALEIRGVAEFAGFVGLSVPRFEAAFTPCVEIGWRLDAAHWGRGYASEAARAVLGHGFRPVGLGGNRLVHRATPNLRSQAVMRADRDGALPGTRFRPSGIVGRPPAAAPCVLPAQTAVFTLIPRWMAISGRHEKTRFTPRVPEGCHPPLGHLGISVVAS